MAILVSQETKDSMRNFTNDNSSCRIALPKQNANNSAGSDRNISTQVGDNSTQTAENNSEVLRIASTQSETYLSVADSQENLNSTSIQMTSSLVKLPKPQRNNSKKRKIDEFFQKEEEISEFEQNINTQKFREIMGIDNSTQTSPLRRIISS